MLILQGALQHRRSKALLGRAADQTKPGRISCQPRVKEGEEENQVKLGMMHHLLCVFAGRKPDFTALKWRPLVRRYTIVSGEIKALWGQDETLLHSREAASAVAVDRKPVSRGLHLGWR